ncbi:LuxR C-terminal-related transcriptional regulator [Blastococcus sp. URHD0036]|uniref:LuxR C-terminal-related transcriptional regulator n=1 Tax=Blastococcus sp. URHD0036 TaxID=1380356 RepID=UPI000496573F|nr:LuxR C-terminal-related transcriptional regulator [Blastococcus sp. URHD0036]
MATPTRRRPRLLAALTSAVEQAPLTLISGPAGAGKTALAASWRDARPEHRDVGWLTLDGFDDDPGTFWSYAVEALARAGADLGGLGRPVPGQSLPASFVPHLAAALMAQSRPVVLVVDNADHLVDRQITGAIDLLIRNAGARLRLVLCARSDPQLPLHTYRLAGVLAEIRSADLAFTPTETADLLAAAGVPATPDVAARLAELTEGWAVGLRLAVAPLKRGMAPEELVAALVQDDGSVAQYLFEEVLRDQPAGVRRFLLRVSVTDELWPDLVDRLGGRPNGRRVLAALASTNAFVEHSPGAPGGFRIHALFREMLRAQLAYAHPTEVTRLHRVCAAWYDAAGAGPAAVHHAVAARDWSLATHLLVEDLLIGHALAHRSDAALPDLAALPADLAAPDAVVVRAATALSTGGLPTPADLAIATEAAGDPANGLALRATAAVVSVAGAAFRGATDLPPDAPGAADDLVAALPRERDAERRDMTAVLSTARFLRTLASDRPTPVLLADLGAAAVAANAAGSRPLRGWPVAYLALLEALAGRLSRAERLARDAAAGWADGPGAEGSPCPAVAVARAWVHLGRFELEAARECADRAAAQTAGSLDERFTAPLLAVVDSCLLRVRHEYAAAEDVLRPHVLDAGLPRWIREEVLTEAVRIALARGRLVEATAVLDAADDDTGWTVRWRATTALLDHSAAVAVPRREPLGARDGSPIVAVQSGVVRACQHLEAGAVPAAVGELSRALDAAARETLRWPFLDAPLQARRLLRTHPDLRGHAEWLSLTPPDRPVRGAGAAPGPARPAPPVQDLSEREREVLVHLAEMLSTTEIAATMFISVNTVRTHIRSILRKLSATRRNQAVRRARELGVI